MSKYPDPLSSAGIIPPAILLEGYRRGIFPMAMHNGEIGWFSPNPRGILPLDGFIVPHGLGRTLRKGKFTIRFDSSFEEVMRACAERDDTWIDERIVASYCRLHQLGYAHSVEAWYGPVLGGGLYGVAIGGAFFGESMFTRVTDASKVALHALVGRMRERGFALLDTQWTTPHLLQFGAIDISRRRYMEMLAEALLLDCELV